MSAQLENFFREFMLEEDESSDSESNKSSEGKPSVNDGHSKVEYTPAWTLKEWHKAQKVSMHNFFTSRIIEDRDIPDDSDAEMEDYRSEDEEQYESEDDSRRETQDETQRLHTQEPFALRALEQPRQRQRRIPHLSQTFHHVQNLEYLDLVTSQFDLPCCEVTKVGKLRNTMRHFTTNTTKEKCKVLNGRLPRMPFPHRLEDGPLLCMYKDVTHLELTNLNGKRIYIYLYKEYAKLFDQWYQDQLKKKNRNAKYWIQLKQIPGICIFPFCIDPDNLADTQQLMKYCICIGDTSSFRVPSKYCGHMESQNTMMDEDTPTGIIGERRNRRSRGHRSRSKSPSSSRNSSPDKSETGNQLQRLRMDNPDVELRFLSTSEGQEGNYANSENFELVLSQASLQDPSARLQKGNLLREWKKYTTKPILGSATKPYISQVRPHSQKRHRKQPEVRLQGTVQSKKVTMPLAPANPDLGSIMYEGTAKRKDKPEDAPEYISLCELRKAVDAQPEYTNFKYSLCAAVVGFTCGRRTKRGDWMMSATLVDETSNEKPTTLIVFAKDKIDFPSISRAGDILHMQDVFLDEWNGNIQINGKKDQSSYLVVRNEEGDDWKVIPTAKDEFWFDDNDEKKSQTLWHWAQHFLQQHSMILPEHSFTLQEMVGVPEASKSDKDMVVMVTGFYGFPPEQQDGRTPYGILRIWDGTGQSASDLMPLPARYLQRHGDPPPEALTKVSEVFDALVAANGREEVGRLHPPKALCGKVANAVIWEESYWEMIQRYISIGSFIRLRNVEVREWKYIGVVSVMVTDRSWLTPIPEDSFEIGSLLREHHKRVQRNEYNPDSGILPISVAENSGRANRVGKGIVSFASNPESTSFVGLVHLGNTHPKYDWDLKKFCVRSHDGSTFAYQFGITLCDNSGMVDVVVGNLPGETIIGMPASVAVGTTKRKRKPIFDPETTWMAKVLKLSHEGSVYFTLVDISHT